MEVVVTEMAARLVSVITTWMVMRGTCPDHGKRTKST